MKMSEVETRDNNIRNIGQEKYDYTPIGGIKTAEKKPNHHSEFRITII